MVAFAASKHLLPPEKESEENWANALFCISVKICNGFLAGMFQGVSKDASLGSPADPGAEVYSLLHFPKTAEISQFFLTFRGCRGGLFASLYSAGISLSLVSCLLEKEVDLQKSGTGIYLGYISHVNYFSSRIKNSTFSAIENVDRALLKLGNQMLPETLCHIRWIFAQAGFMSVTMAQICKLNLGMPPGKWQSHW